jgi:AcrR family transcriptional regulator
MDSAPLPTLRDRQKAQTHELIVDAMIEAMAAGELEKITHDALAKRTGVSRQTVYRHFPDREALLAALWKRTNSSVLRTPLPTTEAELVAALPTLFQRFDANADMVTIVQSTPQGRALRMSVKDKRSKDFLSATSNATTGLSAEDAKLAAAVIQLMCGGHAWLEMRQQWDLTGDQMGVAVGWAVRTLLGDLHARNGRSLGQSSSEPM